MSVRLIYRIVLLPLALANTAAAQDPVPAGSIKDTNRGTNTLTVEHMISDLDELVARIRSVHPATVEGLPSELEKAVESARAKFSEPLPPHQYWLALNRVMHALHDAHSSVAPPRSREVLAMPVLWTDEGIIITEDTGVLHKGDQIIRLDAHTEPQLLDLLCAVIPAENHYWPRYRGETMLKDLCILRALGIATKAPVPLIVQRKGRQFKGHMQLGQLVCRHRTGQQNWQGPGRADGKRAHFVWQPAPIQAYSQRTVQQPQLHALGSARSETGPG